MIHSMTGYAAASAALPPDGARGTLAIELRSVNARFLDLQFRIADELRGLEPPAGLLEHVGHDRELEAHRAHALGPRVEEVPGHRVHADALVVPYLSRHDGHATPAIAAYMSGKPVLACTDSGEARSFVCDGDTGYVVTPDATAVAAGLRSAIDDRADAAERGVRGARSVAGITWDRVVEALTGRQRRSPSHRVHAAARPART